jgi:hypothetical protein
MTSRTPTGRALLVCLGLIGLSACSFDTNLAELTFECSADMPCGEGMICDLEQGACVSEAIAALPPICVEQACTTEDELRCEPAAAAVQVCRRDQSLGCLIWTTEVQCSDKLSCTEDVCDPGALACTGDDCPPPASACSSVLTQGCLIDLDGTPTCLADDALEAPGGCTACVPAASTSSWTVITDGRPCLDDGHTCTADVCTDPSGTCAHPLETGCFFSMDGEFTCLAPGAEDAVGCRSCDPEVRTDGWTHVPAGAQCEDGNPCTVSDACNAGYCIGDAKPCSDGLACTTETCDASTGECMHSLNPGACQIDGACVEAGSPSATNPCLACIPEQGTEIYTAQFNGKSCDDEDVCTTGDACSGGVCFGQGAMDCNDGLACTIDACVADNATGCTHTLQPGTCVIDNQCWNQGAFKPGGDLCLGCFPATDPNAWATADDGASCDDGDLCAVSETCYAGVCQPGVPKDCADGLPCTTDSCNVTTGGCSSTLAEGYCLIGGGCEAADELNVPAGCKTCLPEQSKDQWVPVADGAACSDGNPCSLADACSEGICVPGSSKDCDDGVSCTVDSCDPANGACESSLDGVHCLINGPDGDACVAGEAPSPSNPCLVCQPLKAEKVYSLLAEGSPCDDGDICSLNDACGASGACEGGQTLVCDDGLSCTADACVSEDAVGCVSTLQADWCLIEEAANKLCHASGVTSAPDGCLSCDPGEFTAQWTAAQCDDGLGCTADVCDPETGQCAHLLAEDRCLIAGVCYEDGETSPGNACLACTAGSNDAIWMPLWDTVCHAYPGGAAICEAGTCLFACEGTLADCDGVADTGCEIDTATNPTHCGGCAQLCDEDLACHQGSCTLDCGELTKCGAACAELNTSLAHCGGCDQACGFANAESSCEAGACSYGGCHGGFVDVNGLEADGCECALSGAEICDGLDNDCDGDVDNVSAQLLVSDAEHCGGCEVRCEASDPTQTGVCEDGLCHEVLCAPDTWDLDLQPENGCEYGCVFSGVAELCDGVDQDCDGATDEGYVLDSDPLNCGSCGAVCAATDLADGVSDGVALWGCSKGSCTIEACAEDALDKNLDPSDGCEIVYAPDGTFHVNWLTGNDTTADGTEENPFANIQAAVDAVPSSSWHIEVAAGYYGAVVIPADQPGITLEGAGSSDEPVDGTIITATTHGSGIEVMAHETTVRDLRIEGGQYGIFVHNGSVADTTCCVTEENGSGKQAGCLILEIEVEVCLDAGQAGCCKNNGWTNACIDMVEATSWTCTPSDSVGGFTAQGIVAVDQVGPPGNMALGDSFARPGGDAAGIHLLHTVGAVVLDSVSLGATGGLGAKLSQFQSTSGGAGAGLIVRLSEGFTGIGLTMSDAVGGATQPGGGQMPDVTGGTATGVWLDGATDFILKTLAVTNQRGGLGGVNGHDVCSPVEGGYAAGILVEASSQGQVEEVQILDLSGGDAGNNAEAMKMGQAGGMAAGLWVVGGTQDVVFEVVTISGLEGGLHSQSAEEQATYGVWLDAVSFDNDFSGVSIEEEPVVIWQGVSGLTLGGLTLTKPVNPTNWGKVLVANSDDVELVGLTLAGFRGGHGRSATYYAMPGTAGENATGLHLRDCVGCVVAGLVVSDLVGGSGGNAGAYPHLTTHGSAGGDALGILVDGGSTTIRNLSVSDLVAGQGGLSFLASLNAGNPGAAHGVHVEQFLESQEVLLERSTVNGLSSSCLSNHPDNSPARFKVQDANLFDCGEGGVTYVDNVAVLGGMTYAAPLFVDPHNGDYHLSSASPLIDAGPYGLDYCVDFKNEPEPNGCAANYGAYGNTTEAATKPGADHCVCPVEE